MTADARYPIGPFQAVVPATPQVRQSAVGDIARLPGRLRSAVAGLTDRQLDTCYRPGGWTVRQLVHHVADSHLQAYTRLKLALTEDVPTIKPYDQDRWAALADSGLAVDASLSLLEGLHARWTSIYETFTDEQFARTFMHPELGEQTLDLQLQSYAWHSRHHVAHVMTLRQREGW